MYVQCIYMYMYMYVSQNNASKALLAVMESHQDMEIVDRIYMKIGSPDQLVSPVLKFKSFTGHLRI